EFRLVVRDGGAPRALRLGPPDYDVLHVALSGDGRLAAVACLDGTVRLLDVAPLAERAAFRLDAAATAVALSPDGRWLVHGADSGVLCLRRTDDGALLQCIAAHDARITAIAVAGGAAVSAGRDGRAIVWDLPSLRIRAQRNFGAPLVAAALATRAALARDGEV